MTSKTTYNFLNEPYTEYYPKGDSTNYAYDYLGELIQKKYADQGTSKYAYDRAGRLRFMADSAGLAASPNNILYRKYDQLGRVIEDGYITGTWGTGSSYQSYAYSNAAYPSTPSTWRKKYAYDSRSTTRTYYSGRLWSVQVNDSTGNTAMVSEYNVYDEFGNVDTVKQQAADFGSTVFATAHNYDLLQRPTEVVYPYSTKGAVDVIYNYDMPGRITTVGSSGGSAFAAYTYRTDGYMDSEKVDLGGTMKFHKFGYDTHGRLTSMTGDLFTEKMRYDSGGYHGGEGFYHGLMATDTCSYDTGGPTTSDCQYQYDSLGRLSVAIDPSHGNRNVGNGSPSTYDKDGNILTIKWGTTSALTYHYYTGTNEVQNTSSGTQYKYDADGNVTYSSPVSDTLFRYDGFFHLMTAEKKSNGDSCVFQYGASNQRILKRSTVSGTPTTTLYLHGGNSLPLTERSLGASEYAYVYGPTGLIAFRKDSVWYYVWKDHLGSTRVIFSTGGVGQTGYDFDAYGTLDTATTGVAVNYKYTGQETDVENGLDNYRVRMYDPGLAMFCEADPAHSTTSPYSYANGNPEMYTDPSGTISLAQLFQNKADSVGKIAHEEQEVEDEWRAINGSPDPFTGMYVLYTLGDGNQVYHNLGDSWDQAVYIDHEWIIEMQFESHIVQIQGQKQLAQFAARALFDGFQQLVHNTPTVAQYAGNFQFRRLKDFPAVIFPGFNFWPKGEDTQLGHEAYVDDNGNATGYYNEGVLVERIEGKGYFREDDIEYNDDIMKEAIAANQWPGSWYGWEGAAPRNWFGRAGYNCQDWATAVKATYWKL